MSVYVGVYYRFMCECECVRERKERERERQIAGVDGNQ